MDEAMYRAVGPDEEILSWLERKMGTICENDFAELKVKLKELMKL